MSGTELEQQEDELLIDTSSMNKEQGEALEVAESAREKDYSLPSFGRKLFLGEFDASMISPFPQQSKEDERIGDKLCLEVGRFLKENLDGEEVDQTRTIPENVMRGLAEMGLFGMKISKEYGGLGLSQVNYNRVVQTVASHCGSTAVLLSAHQSIGVPEPLKMFGTEEQKKQFLPRIAKGAISAFALTEPEVGSDPAKMSMTATPVEDGQAYVLNGEKMWCTNGPIAELIVVMAQTPPKMVRGKERQQITAFIVDTATPGIETLHRCDFMGIRGIQNGLLKFTNVRVPAENIVWDQGRGLALALRTLNTGRLTVPAACSAMGKVALSICRRWGKERVQWGLPIAEHEAGADRLARIASGSFAMEAVTWLTSHWADQKQFDLRIEAAIAKLFASELAWEIGNECLQMRGGRGFEKGSSLAARGEEGYPVERMVRDCRINTIIEGTSDIMRLFLAREALDPHLQLAGPLLKRSTGIFKKVGAVFKVLGFYARWYPARLFKLGTKDYSSFGELAGHMKFIEKTSNKMARTLFHKMARYQAGLEKRQLVLGGIIDIAVELFAMAASCSYAKSMQESVGSDSPQALADHFCEGARRRIAGHFETISDTKAHRQSRVVAKRVLDGEMRWLEEGIIWMGKPES